MVFIECLKKKRWSLIIDKSSGSYYRMRIGSRGLRGCKVPQLGKLEERDIIAWFNSLGIVRGEPLNMSCVFSYKPFGYFYNTALGHESELMYHGGMEFRLSEDAFARMFPKQADVFS